MPASVGSRIEEQKRSNPLGLRNEVHAIRPIAENTRYVDAGPLSIGVEYRFLNDKVIDEYFEPDAPDLKIIRAKRIEGGFDEQGLSIHIIDRRNSTEYIRFDMFPGEPHYHYIPDRDYQYIIPYDPNAAGDFEQFALQCIRLRLPAMLRFVGADEFADEVAKLDMEAMSERVGEETKRAAP